MKKIALNFVNQIIPVMIGVYLGFAMNNFGENRKLRSQTNVFKTMLLNELNSNLEQINQVSSYHIQLNKDFSDILNAESIVKEFNNYNFRGFRSGFVNSSAYNTGIQTGIVQELDLELIQSLNSLYTLQGKYNRFNENMVNSFLSDKFPETEREMKSILISATMSMEDVKAYEKELANFYTVVIKKIN